MDMITVLVVLGVTGIVLYLMHDDFMDAFLYLLVGMVGVMVSVMVLMVLKSVALTEGVHYRLVTTTEEVSRVEISSISLGSEVRGDFFLGIGSVGSSPTFFGYQKFESGEYQLLEMSGDSRIEYSEETPSYITYQNQVRTEGIGFTRWLFINPCWSCQGTYNTYRILVPHGTIQEQYQL